MGVHFFWSKMKKDNITQAPFMPGKSTTPFGKSFLHPAVVRPKVTHEDKGNGRLKERIKKVLVPKF